ncbi:MAG: VWA domain-containing protein [Acidobacteria bacterium]|nr:VWA domain-containing protein [Acidobacteriota bacterium]
MTVAALAATPFTAATMRAQAAATTVDRALLILLDVSGSMKEGVRGGVKNDLAVQGLLTTLQSLPPGTDVGLRLMGEGPGDEECGATRLAVSISPFARERWDQVLEGIAWKGATPLVHSMRAALEDLRRIPARQRELLIIGDGDETCGEDPVGVARAEAHGIRIHAISLGEDVSHQLAGIALVTGGTYARAFDETSFAEATGTSVPSAQAGATPQSINSGGTGQLEIILDLSNSMWGQVNGKSKIDLARRALTSALTDLPANIPVGLRVYGHRVSVDDKEAGCADTERLIAPAPGQGPAIAKMSDTLQPKGHTPIARSLQEAGADLKRDGTAGVIVLVSDGVESCGGNPEAVAAQLRSSGVDVVIHTVGLGVNDVDRSVLAALAAAGGGQYFDAGDAPALTESINTAVRSSREFMLERDVVSRFPSPITRVSGGATVDTTKVLEPGYFSFTDHMFKDQRYFGVRGIPGSTITVLGMVSALEIGRTRAGVVTFQGSPNMMFVERIDQAGERLRGQSLNVRGDMGSWHEMVVTVGNDGFARFRIGRPQGNIHRDMVFQIVQPPRI